MTYLNSLLYTFNYLSNTIYSIYLKFMYSFKKIFKKNKIIREHCLHLIRFASKISLSLLSVLFLHFIRVYTFLCELNRLLHRNAHG